MTHAEVLSKVGAAKINVQDWMLTAVNQPAVIAYGRVPDIKEWLGSVGLGTIASSKAAGLASANLTVADLLDRPIAWLDMGPSKSGTPQPWTVTGDFAQAVRSAWSDVPAVNNYTVNGLGYITGEVDYITPPVGTTVQAKASLSTVDAIATQMAVVYMGRPVSHKLLNTLEKMAQGRQPDAATLALISSKAVADGAFGAGDSSAQIVTNTFKNIMGFLPNEYEQKEWGKYSDNGTLTRQEAPWVIFRSYLGANNVPEIYQKPTQARFVAAQTFMDYVTTDVQDAALDALNSGSAARARSWLAPIDSVAAAAAKMPTLIGDIQSVTLVGTAAPAESMTAFL